MNKTHELKTWPEPFNALFFGRKTFEFRRNDRDFHEGDKLILKEYSPAQNTYTGRIVEARIEYILHGGAFGLPEGFCIMSLHTIRIKSNQQATEQVVAPRPTTASLVPRSASVGG